MDETAFKRFTKRLTFEQETGCLLWAGAKGHGGYGRFRLGEKTVRAHRAAFEHWNGPIPADMQLDHLCRVRHCCAPDHLEAVTPLENIRRASTAGTHVGGRTHCPAGHEYSEVNTYRYSDGRRACRTCMPINKRKYRRRLREAGKGA